MNSTTWQSSTGYADAGDATDIDNEAPDRPSPGPMAFSTPESCESGPSIHTPSPPRPSPTVRPVGLGVYVEQHANHIASSIGMTFGSLGHKPSGFIISSRRPVDVFGLIGSMPSSMDSMENFGGEAAGDLGRVGLRDRYAFGIHGFPGVPEYGFGRNVQWLRIQYRGVKRAGDGSLQELQERKRRRLDVIKQHWE